MKEPHEQFRDLCNRIIEVSKEHPGDGLQALTAALDLCMFDRNVFAAVDSPNVVVNQHGEFTLSLTNKEMCVLYVILITIAGVKESTGRKHADSLLKQVQSHLALEVMREMESKSMTSMEGVIIFKGEDFL